MLPRKKISIHAPLAGSDLYRIRERKVVNVFQSTLPSQGATEALENAVAQCRISIHAPLAGSDKARTTGKVKRQVISIHAPLAGSD